MSDTNTLARSMHDVGLAAWFGGALMGAVGLNGAAANAADPRQRAKIATEGWKRWAPLNAAAVGAHLMGAVALLYANRGRLAGQQGVAASSTAKTALTAAAVAATAASGILGSRVDKASDAPAEGATEPSAQTPPEVAGAQRSLQRMQWVIPALTGAVLVISSHMGEQQRPAPVASGLAQRLLAA